MFCCQEPESVVGVGAGRKLRLETTAATSSSSSLLRPDAASSIPPPPPPMWRLPDDVDINDDDDCNCGSGTPPFVTKLFFIDGFRGFFTFDEAAADMRESE